MAAIIGPSGEEVQRLCDEASRAGVVTVANLNAPTQTVASGEEAGVMRLIDLAREAGAKRALRLQVGAAFHSELMIPVYERLRETIEQVSFSDPQIPLVAVASAEVLRSAEDIREALLTQIISPVRWVEVVQRLVQSGCNSFLELGPGRVLIGLIRQIQPDVEMAAADSLQKLDEFASARA
jgi:[acyl-carrier-protein] S-malonyltransferase